MDPQRQSDRATQSTSSNDAKGNNTPAFTNAAARNDAASKPTIKASIPKAPTLSLPKGGGAVQGMGDKFNMNLSNGTGSMSLPIKVSDGRAGFQPSLSLDYSSMSGSSEFGLGWQLNGFNPITRKTSKGLPQYRDSGSPVDDDVFVMPGSEDLVPVFKTSSSGETVFDTLGQPVILETTLDGHKVRVYQPRIVKDFSRIERFAKLDDPFDIHWRVTTAENIVTIYGATRDSRIQDPKTTDDMNPRIFSWLPVETYDSKGNAMIFQYKRESSENVTQNTACELHRDDISRTANMYLKVVRYGNTTPNRDLATWIPFSALTLPADTWKFSIVLDYGEHDLANPTPLESSVWFGRQDPFSSYLAGFEVRKYRLCQRVLMFHHFQELGTDAYLVRSTDLGYTADAQVAYLTSVTQRGYVKKPGVETLFSKSFPPMEFTYSQLPSIDDVLMRPIQSVDQESIENLPTGLAGNEYQWIDLDEEGIPGILTSRDDCWYYKRNQSAYPIHYQGSSESLDTISSESLSDTPTPPAQFGPLESVSLRPRVNAEDPTMFFGDVNGAGKLDLVVASPTGWGYYEREDDAIGWKPFREFSQRPNVPYPHPEVRMIDLSGDGIPDVLVQLADATFWLPSMGSDGFGPTAMLSRATDEIDGPCCVYSDPTQAIFFTDMSGDGLADIVRVRNGNCCYWPNTGYGTFGKQIIMDDCPYFGDSFRASRVRLADIDGSGIADLLYLGDSGVDWYCNRAGNGFADPRHIALPPVDEQCTIHTVDLLGNGTHCMLYSSPLPGDRSTPLLYVDIFAGKKPHLLTSSKNNLGMETWIRYASSTKFYAQDKAEGNPWITKLPFPVHVVESVESYDTIGKNRFVTRYRYHHGHYDGLEREFCGFAKVEQWDSEDFATNDVLGVSNANPAWHSPPVRTVNWFHTGAFVNKQAIDILLAEEFFNPAAFQASSSTMGLLSALDASTLPPNSDDALQMREACRALKGHSIRTEIYADDGSDKSRIPYSINQTNFKVSAKQETQDAHQHAVYFVESFEALVCSLERSVDDPCVRHDLVLQSDSFGNPLKALNVSYGRQKQETTFSHPALATQQRTHCVYTEFDFTNAIDDRDSYRLPLPAETRIFEISGLPHNGRYKMTDLVGNDFQVIKALPKLSFGTIPDGTQPGSRLFKRARVLYRRNDLSSLLPPRTVESLAISGAQYELALTLDILRDVFSSTGSESTNSGLIPSPSELTSLLAKDGGYLDLDRDGNWWKPSNTLSFSANATAKPSDELVEARRGFFSGKRFIDAFGQATVATYDRYQYFVLSTTDAVGNTVRAEFDYRVLLPSLVIDHNENRQQAATDALGMVAGTAILGKQSDNLGNTLEGFNADLEQAQIDAFLQDISTATALNLLGRASTRLIYDLSTATDSTSPVFAASIVRENHVNDPAAAEGKVQIKIQYSDGFGRIIQTKDLVDPGSLVQGGPAVASRWTCSGWTVHNNKGLVVKQFENFFDDKKSYRAEYQVGHSPTFLYDPIRRLAAILHPDHAVEKYVIEPWVQHSYDSNDNILLSDPSTDPDVGTLFKLLPKEDFLPSWRDDPTRMSGFGKDAALKTAKHANTPGMTFTDALGRVILAVADTGVEKLANSSVHDVEGKVVENKDASGRLTTKTAWAMSGERIHHTTMDAGEEWALTDVLGCIIRKWTNRPCRYRYVHDALCRPTKTFVTDGAGPENLMQEIVYGEEADGAVDHNLRGQVWKVRDQAGLITQAAFNENAQLLQSTRQLSKAYHGTRDVVQNPELEIDLFQVTTTWDALNRPVKSTQPNANISYFSYGQSGRVNQIYVNIQGQRPVDSDPKSWTPVVKRSDFNAHGLETIIEYGNGTTTTKYYDAILPRLERIQTSRTSGSDVQDLTYTYDPMGNVTHVTDAAQQTTFFRGTRVEPSRDYTYDAIYRLTRATGREHLGQTNGRRSAPKPYNNSDAIRTRQVAPGDAGAMGLYFEDYNYDAVGNIKSLSHSSSDAGQSGWTRRYNYLLDSQLEPGIKGNRLGSIADDGTTGSFTYDTEGNMTSMPHLRSMNWNSMRQLESTSRQVIGNNQTPETTYYVYDWKGERVRKVTESDSVQTANGIPRRLYEHIYLNGFEVSRKYLASSPADVEVERTTMSVNGADDRLAVIEQRTKGSDEGLPLLLRFQVTDLLGSSCVELTDQADLLSYEEYFPFGSTSYQAVRNQTDLPKRYRYTGKELDSENDLYYHGARYYAPWLCRWTACDPQFSLDSPYVYCNNNPVAHADPDGRQAWGPWRRVWRVSSEQGTMVHDHVLPELSRRLVRMGYAAWAEEPTAPGGSKEAPGVLTTKKGLPRVGYQDLVIMVPDTVKPALLTLHIYDLKHQPYWNEQERTKDHSFEGRHYSDYANFDKSGADLAMAGRILEDIVAHGGANVLAPVTWQEGDVQYRARLSLPGNGKGGKVAGLVYYILEKREKKKQRKQRQKQRVRVPVPLPIPVQTPQTKPATKAQEQAQPVGVPGGQEAPVVRPALPDVPGTVPVFVPGTGGAANDNAHAPEAGGKAPEGSKEEEQPRVGVAAKTGAIALGVLAFIVGVAYVVLSGGGAVNLPQPAGFAVGRSGGPEA